MPKTKRKSKSTTPTQSRSLTPLLLVLLLVLGFFFVLKMKKNNEWTDDSWQDSQVRPMANTSNNTSTSMTNPKKAYNFNNCNIGFNLPQRPTDTTAPYWQITGSSHPILISKFASYLESNAMYDVEDGGTDMVAQAVSVGCAVNNRKYANNAEALKALQMGLAKYNESIDPTMQAMKEHDASAYTIVASTPNQRWGHEVLDLTVQDDTGTTMVYSFFVTPKFVYQVNIWGTSIDPMVTGEAQQIFDTLEFN